MSANLFADGSDEICYGLSRDAPSVSEAAERPRPVERERGASGTDPEDLTPLSKQQSDLGSLFSIDDFNPFSINSDHFDEQNNADRTITDGELSCGYCGLDVRESYHSIELGLSHSYYVSTAFDDFPFRTTPRAGRRTGNFVKRLGAIVA